jgi:hypothetical protein
LENPVVEFEEKVAGMDDLIVVDEDLHDRTGNACGDGMKVAGDLGIIRADMGFRIPVEGKGGGHKNNDNGRCPPNDPYVHALSFMRALSL